MGKTEIVLRHPLVSSVYVCLCVNALAVLVIWLTNSMHYFLGYYYYY